MKKKMKKKTAAMVLSLVLVILLTACGSSTDTPADTADTESADVEEASGAEESLDTEKELVKIGWSSDVLSTNFTSGIATKFQEVCDGMGIEIEMQDANRDMNLQINQVENMIANGCQAIILKPYDQSACEPISQTCKEAGVPLIVILNDITSDYDCAVKVDNAEIGRLKAEAIVEKLGGKGNVAILNGTLSQQSWTVQADAAKEVFAQYPDITIVDEQVAENNDQANAINVAENWITSGIDIDAIWCSQDTVAMGAGTSFKEAGLDVYVIGQGGMEDAQAAIKNGTLSATLYLPGSVYVDGAMKAVQALFYGEPIDKDVYVELSVLSAENIDTFDFN